MSTGQQGRWKRESGDDCDMDIILRKAYMCGLVWREKDFFVLPSVIASWGSLKKEPYDQDVARESERTGWT